MSRLKLLLAFVVLALSSVGCAVDETQLATELAPDIEPPPAHLLYNPPVADEPTVETEAASEPESAAASGSESASDPMAGHDGDNLVVVLVIAAPIDQGVSVAAMLEAPSSYLASRTLDAAYVAPQAIGSIAELRELEPNMVARYELDVGAQLLRSDLASPVQLEAEVAAEAAAAAEAEALANSPILREAEQIADGVAQMDAESAEAAEAARLLAAQAEAALAEAEAAFAAAEVRLNSAAATDDEILAWCDAWATRPERPWAADSHDIERAHWDALLIHDATWPPVPGLTDTAEIRTNFLIAARAFVIDLGLNGAELRDHAGFELIRSETGSDEYPDEYGFFAAEYCLTPDAD